MERSGNKILYGLVALVLVISVPIILKTDGVKHETMDRIPSLERASGDTTADTLATVQAELRRVEKANRDIVSINDKLVEERQRNNNDVESIKQSHGHINESVDRLVKTEVERHRETESLRSEIRELRQLLKNIEDKKVSEEQPEHQYLLETGERPSDRLNGRWETPLDYVEEEAERFSLLRSADDKQKNEKFEKNEVENAVKKRITIAENGTSLNSVALTALVGRIPVKSKVQEPYPFKLIMGEKNIMANCMDLPEVEGMIWSGLATGDWNLSCVSGKLKSVTFIFKSGHIVTHRSDGGDDIGWVSDEKGFPCVTGKFITNAPEFLTQRTGLAMLGVASEAYADAQRTTRSNLVGAESFISGSTGKYVLGQSISSATAAVSNWLLERQQQSFDAVVVSSGARVGIHITKELEIDLDEQGRKLVYEQTNQEVNAFLP